jgi:hypothetical protein
MICFILVTVGLLNRKSSCPKEDPILKTYLFFGFTRKEEVEKDSALDVLMATEVADEAAFELLEELVVLEPAAGGISCS